MLLVMKGIKIMLFAVLYVIIFMIMGTVANYTSSHYYEGKDFLDLFASGWPLTILICILPFFVLVWILKKSPHPRTIGIVSLIINVGAAINLPFMYHKIGPGQIIPFIGYLALAFLSLKMAVSNTLDSLLEDK